MSATQTTGKIMSLDDRTRAEGSAAYWVAITFAILAITLAWGPLPFASPIAEPVVVPASVTDPTPVRHPSPQPRYRVGEFTYECSECHRATPVPQTAGAEFTKHAEITLAHGMNTRCLNCHHPTNRNAFVDDFGEEIPWTQPQLLCARCHGPVYRDWQHGSHGRINGYWDTTRGEQVRLRCVACHDPHQPPFAPLSTSAGPNTLRAAPHDAATHESVDNPLRVTDDHPSTEQNDKVVQEPTHE